MGCVSLICGQNKTLSPLCDIFFDQTTIRFIIKVCCSSGQQVGTRNMKAMMATCGSCVKTRSNSSIVVCGQQHKPTHVYSFIPSLECWSCDFDVLWLTSMLDIFRCISVSLPHLQTLSFSSLSQTFSVVQSLQCVYSSASIAVFVFELHLKMVFSPLSVLLSSVVVLFSY